MYIGINSNGCYFFAIHEVNANETVTILEPDGSIQICSVTDSGVIICL